MSKTRVILNIIGEGTVYGAFLGTMYGGIIGFAVFFFGAFLGLPWGLAIGTVTGFVVSIVLSIITIVFFYPLSNRKCYHVTLFLFCVPITTVMTWGSWNRFVSGEFLKIVDFSSIQYFALLSCLASVSFTNHLVKWYSSAVQPPTQE